MTTIRDWLIQIPIKPENLAELPKNLQPHVQHLQQQVKDGKIVFGGPTLAAQPTGPEDMPKPTSSVYLIKAETEQEVYDIVNGNAFAKAGVWDVEKSVITPFRCTVRQPMA